MMHKKILYLSIATLLSLPLAAKAEDGYYDLINNKTVLTLSESARKEVEQDRIKAILRVEKDARDAAVVQNFINEKMADAIKIAKSIKSLKVSTGNYRVNERYNSKLRENDGWQGSQQIILDTENKEDLLETVQKLQKSGFVMDNMNYYLSVDKAATYRTELVREALQRVQDSAKGVAEQLGAKHYHIGAIDVSNAGNVSPRMHMAMAKTMMADSLEMAAPVVESSDETVSVSIQVKVVLDMND